MGSDSIFPGDGRNAEKIESDPIFRAQALMARLGLQPHPEGGFYAEVHRSSTAVQPADERGVRAALSAIYFLLVDHGFSRWHRVRSDEVWIHLEGASVALHLLDADGPRQVMLGPLATASADEALASLATPQHTVPADVWQAARVQGAYALVACVVAPGFAFDDFTLMDPASELAGRLRDQSPELAELI